MQNCAKKALFCLKSGRFDSKKVLTEWLLLEKSLYFGGSLGGCESVQRAIFDNHE
jgi:hypothetical protein